MRGFQPVPHNDHAIHGRSFQIGNAACFARLNLSPLRERSNVVGRPNRGPEYPPCAAIARACSTRNDDAAVSSTVSLRFAGSDLRAFHSSIGVVSTRPLRRLDEHVAILRVRAGSV